MAKVFIDLTQTYHKRVIMDITPYDTNDTIMERIQKHLNNNGGASTIIDQGGKITIENVMNKVPTFVDEQTYECID